MAAETVDPSRFKYLRVATKCSIQDFAMRHKLVFRPGRGFYQLTKPETIQVPSGGSRIFVRGTSGVLTPVGALSPKFAQHAGFS